MILPHPQAVNAEAFSSRSSGRLRDIRPRRPPPYENEIHGRDHRTHQAILSWSEEDRQDSRAIAEANRNVAVLTAKDSWVGSEAESILAALPKSGTWVPTWIARVSGHPARAILLSWILDLFNDGQECDEKGNRLCRARAIDDAGRRWWRATRRRVVEETLLDAAAADRARHSLVKHGFIQVDSSSAGLLIRPCAEKLAQEYYRLTQDPEVLDELRHFSDHIEWFGSHTRTRATQPGVAGNEVHDALMILCERRPGPALVLAHILHWHGASESGNFRARVLRRGNLWMARSWRQLQANPGGDAASLAGCIDWLSERAFVVAEKDRWRWLSGRDHGRPTLHVRPNPAAIATSLKQRTDEILRVIQRKRQYLSPQDQGVHHAEAAALQNPNEQK
jgi:hypothetical protein